MSSRFSILVVEDDTVLRDGLRKVLEMSGYAVTIAIHGADALEKVRAGGALPSLILLDLNMPVMSGKEFLARLRAESEALASIPVLVITADPNAEVTGVAGIIHKPFGVRALLEKVRSLT